MTLQREISYFFPQGKQYKTLQSQSQFAIFLDMCSGPDSGRAVRYFQVWAIRAIRIDQGRLLNFGDFFLVHLKNMLLNILQSRVDPEQVIPALFKFSFKI